MLRSGFFPMLKPNKKTKQNQITKTESKKEIMSF